MVLLLSGIEKRNDVRKNDERMSRGREKFSGKFIRDQFPPSPQNLKQNEPYPIRLVLCIFG